MYATPAAPRKDQVFRMTQALDEKMDPWRNRSIEQPYPYLVVDVRYEYVPEISTITFEILNLEAALPEIDM